MESPVGDLWGPKYLFLYHCEKSSKNVLYRVPRWQFEQPLNHSSFEHDVNGLYIPSASVWNDEQEWKFACYGVMNGDVTRLNVAYEFHFLFLFIGLIVVLECNVWEIQNTNTSKLCCAVSLGDDQFQRCESRTWTCRRSAREFQRLLHSGVSRMECDLWLNPRRRDLREITENFLNDRRRTAHCLRIVGEIRRCTMLKRCSCWRFDRVGSHRKPNWGARWVFQKPEGNLWGR